jgi:small subunit ribosomal protein S20
MPITKSAKKVVRAVKARTERNKAMKTKLKTFMKKVIELSKTDVEKAKQLLPEAYSVIDTACKKNIIVKNTASRRKSRLARVVAAGESKKGGSEASAEGAKEGSAKVAKAAKAPKAATAKKASEKASAAKKV